MKRKKIIIIHAQLTWPAYSIDSQPPLENETPYPSVVFADVVVLCCVLRITKHKKTFV